jgi:hypothetical protein
VLAGCCRGLAGLSGYGIGFRSAPPGPQPGCSESHTSSKRHRDKLEYLAFATVTGTGSASGNLPVLNYPVNIETELVERRGYGIRLGLRVDGVIMPVMHASDSS